MVNTRTKWWAMHKRSSNFCILLGTRRYRTTRFLFIIRKRTEAIWSFRASVQFRVFGDKNVYGDAWFSIQIHLWIEQVIVYSNIIRSYGWNTHGFVLYCLTKHSLFLEKADMQRLGFSEIINISDRFSSSPYNRGIKVSKIWRVCLTSTVNLNLTF